MRKLHETLLERQLLVSYTVRERYSKILSIVCCVHLLVLGVVLAFVSGIRNWEAILLLAVITAVNGFALRFLSMLPTFIPFYEELTAVLDSVQRTGFRITVLRAILKFLRTGYWSLILLGGAAIFALEALAFGQFFHLASNIWWLNLLALLALTYNFFSMADLAGLSYYIANNEQLSSKGEELRRRYHLQLKSVSPIKAFTAVLADTDYNDQLSDIVAIYGVETLFLLA